MKKMNVIQKFVLAGIVLMSFGQSSFMFGAGDNVNPLTGQEEANRSCLQKDDNGNCIEWKVLSDGKWMVESACKGPCMLKLRDRLTACTGTGANCKIQLPL